MSRFPLIGAHATADCRDCHLSASLLNFEPLGIECYDCHMADYRATSEPDHQLAGFSRDCAECHLMNAFTWRGPSFNHSFFPLTEGHAISDCRVCHTDGNYTSTSAQCYSCHRPDYENTGNPNHLVADLSTNCDECHSTWPGWKPADFTVHDGLFFPIYSGQHNGEWASCTDCHADPSNYAMFTCIDCHEHNKEDTDDEHEDINGYLYQSQACFDCHPTGDAEGGFDHSITAFPLTGAHVTTACADCHTNAYSGTSTYCADCHGADFEQTTNPNHNVIGLQDNCASCHTTQPGWKPASFPLHNDYYLLSGAHATISSVCAACHNGDYVSTPGTCVGCHLPDYQQSQNPDHLAIGVGDDCALCHTSDPGWEPALFPVHDNYYPLTGGHAVILNNCALCHNGNYSSTPNTCAGCHTGDYNQASDPDHVLLGFSFDCLGCHTTNPGWTPASFDEHDQYYVLEGAHVLIAGECFLCHQGSYVNTPNTCVGCHLDDYNQTSDPDHEAAQFPTDCESCHSQVAWEPSTFNHDLLYFPIYSGQHKGEWDNCTDCHINPGNYAVFSCIDCHEHNQPDMDNEHDDVSGYVYNSIACLDCHPDGNAKVNRVINQFR